MSRTYSWLVLLLPLCSAPAVADSHFTATTWCTSNDTGYYDCGQGWSCGYIGGDPNRGCVWPRGTGPHPGGGGGGGGNHDTSAWPPCDGSATGRFDCGFGKTCGYPNGNTETACTYP